MWEREDTKKSDLYKVNLRQLRVNNTHARIIAWKDMSKDDDSDILSSSSFQ